MYIKINTSVNLKNNYFNYLLNMSDTKQCILEEEMFYEQLEIEIYRNDKENSVYDDLSLLYDETIGSYQNGEQALYNPNIFYYMTKKKFINWVMNCNPDLKKEFQPN